MAFERDPGTAFGYSGEGFEYLARFAERRTATPFEQLAELYVFRPAGMTRTAYTNRPWFAGQVATPSDQNGQWLDPVIRDRFVASDDVHTTASDYAQFLIGAGQGAGLGPAEAADRARVQASTREARCTGSRAASCPDEMGFGLGWDVAVFGEDRILWHTGGDQGEFTIAYIIPRTGEGMVILTNSAKGYRVVLPIMERAGVHPRFLAFLKAQAG